MAALGVSRLARLSRDDLRAKFVFHNKNVKIEIFDFRPKWLLLKIQRLLNFFRRFAC
jgi:hypothetical protein